METVGIKAFQLFSLVFCITVELRFRRCKSDSDYNYVPYSYHPTLKDLEENLKPSRDNILTKAFFSITYGVRGPPRIIKSLDDVGSKRREDKDDP